MGLMNFMDSIIGVKDALGCGVEAFGTNYTTALGIFCLMVVGFILGMFIARYVRR